MIEGERLSHPFRNSALGEHPARLLEQLAWIDAVGADAVTVARGLMISVGLLVDNSVVVAENIFRLHREGMSRRQACIQGAGEIALAIVMATLTTIIVFAPVVLAGDDEIAAERHVHPRAHRDTADLGDGRLWQTVQREADVADVAHRGADHRTGRAGEEGPIQIEDGCRAGHGVDRTRFPGHQRRARRRSTGASST